MWAKEGHRRQGDERTQEDGRHRGGQVMVEDGRWTGAEGGGRAGREDRQGTEDRHRTGAQSSGRVSAEGRRPGRRRGWRLSGAEDGVGW
jgi:hypothetical protein